MSEGSCLRPFACLTRTAANTGRRYVPQSAAEVAKAELLLHNGLGLPLPVCWQILDMAEYWLQVRFTDPVKLDQWDAGHPETMKLRMVVPEVQGFKAMRKVVLAIGGHNTRACVPSAFIIPTLIDGWVPFAGRHTDLTVTREGMADQAWHSFEVETGGDLPRRSITHHRPPQPYWDQDIPAVHLITWRYDDDGDDGEAERTIASLRPNAQLHLTATAPHHLLWKEHVVPLRVELYYSCL